MEDGTRVEENSHRVLVHQYDTRLACDVCLSHITVVFTTTTNSNQCVYEDHGTRVHSSLLLVVAKMARYIQAFPVRSTAMSSAHRAMIHPFAASLPFVLHMLVVEEMY